MDTFISPGTIGRIPQRNTTWQTWLVDGDKYMSAATPKGEKSRFSREILYNLLSLSLENYVMAILDFYQQLPENHTYTDLISALDGVIPVSDSLKSRILKFENIQSICSVEKYHRKSPSSEDLLQLKEAILEIGEIAHNTCRFVRA